MPPTTRRALLQHAANRYSSSAFEFGDRGRGQNQHAFTQRCVVSLRMQRESTTFAVAVKYCAEYGRVFSVTLPMSLAQLYTGSQDSTVRVWSCETGDVRTMWLPLSTAIYVYRIVIVSCTTRRRQRSAQAITMTLCLTFTDAAIAKSWSCPLSSDHASAAMRSAQRRSTWAARWTPCCWRAVSSSSACTRCG